MSQAFRNQTPIRGLLRRSSPRHPLPLHATLRFFSCSIRLESKPFAFSNSLRRAALNPFPPRLMKYISIRIPETGPFGETFFDANVRAIVLASLVNSPFGGCVESVFTSATHRFFCVLAMETPEDCNLIWWPLNLFCSNPCVAIWPSCDYVFLDARVSRLLCKYSLKPR